MSHVFRHPKYYKKFKKDKSPRGDLSPESSSEDSSIKQQASSDKPQAATNNTRDRDQES
jgi:hypothetical protein